uniref:Retroviral polymerase SH3-like domain-containing protein n=1 Tax=Tanacetum cinerariifolium TaxID=118510 RepID=A0A699ISJ8_TANCI|nr:hypothetical protein [Tanacetum cinerariifolium]
MRSWHNINCPSWNRLAFYDDDDDEYSIKVIEKSPIAITPVLPTEKPEISLIMGDEHLITILEIESYKVIKSSVEDLVAIPSESEDTSIVNSPKIDTLLEEFASELTHIDYVEASPPDSELVSLEESPSSYFLFYSENSLPEFETFSDHTKETSSGSTTTHADNSLPEYDSFLFEIEPDQEDPDLSSQQFSSNTSEKGDECIFVGYSTQLRAYRVFKKRTRVIMESIHVNFDELPQMASDHISSDPAPECQRMALEHDSLSPAIQRQENVSQADRTVTTSNELDLLFSPMFD